MKYIRFVILLLLAAILPSIAPAQAPDSTCLKLGHSARDSLARIHLPSVRDTTRLTQYQQRAYGTLSAVLALKCVQPIVVVPPPPPPDTTPTPTGPAATINLILSLSSIATRPTQPFMSFLTVGVDSAGVRLTDSAVVSLSDSGLAKLYWNRFARRYELYTEATGTRSGSVIVTARRGTVSASVALTVVGPAAPPPPPPPPDTTSPAPLDTTAAGILAALGPKVTTLAEAQALGGGWAQLDQRWKQFEPLHWASDSANWAAANYYDRCEIYIRQAIRFGNSTYSDRGREICFDYVTKYLEPNAYNWSPHWAQLDGLVLDCRIFKAARSCAAIEKGLHKFVPLIRYTADTSIKSECCNEGRIMARHLQGMLVGWQFNIPGAPAGGWGRQVDTVLTAILSVQGHDGAFRSAATCHKALNYMNAMLGEMLIRVHKVRPDPRIPPALRSLGDFLRTQWRPGDQVPSFNYYEGLCINKNGTAGATPSPDLNGIFLPLFSHLASVDSSYRALADDIVAAVVLTQPAIPTAPYWQGTKQFNQLIGFSLRGLGYLP